MDNIWPGRPYPLGATFDGTGVNFAVFSEVAERVRVAPGDGSGRAKVGQRVRRGAGAEVRKLAPDPVDPRFHGDHVAAEGRELPQLEVGFQLRHAKKRVQLRLGRHCRPPAAPWACDQPCRARIRICSENRIAAATGPN